MAKFPVRLRHKVRKQQWAIQFDTVNGQEYYSVQVNGRAIPLDHITIYKPTWYKNTCDVYYRDIKVINGAGTVSRTIYNTGD